MKASKNKLKIEVEKVISEEKSSRNEVIKIFSEVRKGLESGEIRSAEKICGKWQVNAWVKQAILLAFKYGALKEINGNCKYFDKDTLPLHKFHLKDKVRIVPGGSSVRCGACIAAGTVIMPPSYINIGSYIDSGCMIDSHVLVGSCAQIGKNVHLSAAAQIGGVLEPIGAMPVIIEDNVFIGGNCGIYEGVIIEENAVIASGVIINSSTPVFDSTRGVFIKKISHEPLSIPKNAVVVSGTRPLKNEHGIKNNIHLYCPVIVKYRDSKTDLAIILEDLLR